VAEFKPPPLGDVAQAEEYGALFEPLNRRTDQFYESPSRCTAQSNFDEAADLLVLDADK